MSILWIGLLARARLQQVQKNVAFETQNILSVFRFIKHFFPDQIIHTLPDIKPKLLKLFESGFVVINDLLLDARDNCPTTGGNERQLVIADC